MSTSASSAKWPKTIPQLSPAQLAAREAWYIIWLERYHNHSILDRFNSGFPASLPVPEHCRTLNIGPGIDQKLTAEEIGGQEYHVLELREEFCKRLTERLPAERVHLGSIEERQPFPDGSFDRVIAVHVLEHLPNLPAALDEISRLLTPDGVLDVVLPCEGGLVYSLARRVSSKRLFEKEFKMKYEPIIRSEHVSELWEVKEELAERFRAEKTRHYPFPVPLDTINIFVGYRFRKKT